MRRRVIGAGLASLLVAAVLAALPAQPAAASPFWVGPENTVYLDAQSAVLGIDHWPDGEMGVERSGSTYTFYAANGGGDVQRTTGALEAPAATQVQNISIANVPAEFPYAAGGPVHSDATSGIKLLVTHLERTRTDGGYYGSIGLSRSTDGGMSWVFLGEIVRSVTAPNECTSTNGPVSTDPGSGTSEVRSEGGTDYLYIYVHDRQSCSQYNSLSVARAPLTDVLAAAAAGAVSPWAKYYAGSWAQPGIGGLATDLWPDPGLPFTTFGSIAWNSYLGKYILVVTRLHPLAILGLIPAWRIELLESDDGVTWSMPQTVAEDVLELFYPTLVGTGDDPAETGQTFWVYYTRSLFGGFSRFNPADINRRGITFQ